MLAAMTEHKLAISRAVEAEYLDVLSRPKFAKILPPARRDAFISLLLSNSVLFEPKVRVRECRDPGDDIYLELALVADAVAIVSGDADLLVLGPWRGIPILTASSYLRGMAGATPSRRDRLSQRLDETRRKS